MAKKPAPKRSKPSKGKAPAGKRRRRKVRLTLKSSKIKDADSYSDSVGWQGAERVLDAPEKPKEPEFLRHQCEQCGMVQNVKKPRRAKYTITCANPDCQHVESFP